MASLILTIVGPDRPGLVRALSEAVAARGGSWLESRMARLAGQFAGIVLVEAPEVDCWTTCGRWRARDCGSSFKAGPPVRWLSRQRNLCWRWRSSATIARASCGTLPRSWPGAG